MKSSSPKLSFFPSIKQRLRNWLNEDATTTIHNMLEEREESALTADDKELLHAAIKFNETEAEEIAIARSDVIALDSCDTFKDVLKVMQSSQHSRFPVINEVLDAVIGFITQKDFMQFVGKEKTFDLASITRPVTFVTASTPLPKVLRLMKFHKVQMVVVTDEYGGTAGLITLKDILETLVGDVADEHESIEQMIVHCADSCYTLDPRLPLEAFAAHFGVALPQDDDNYETIGGMLLHIAGRVPATGDAFPIDGVGVFKVLDSDGRRIQDLEFHAS